MKPVTREMSFRYYHKFTKRMVYIDNCSDLNYWVHKPADGPDKSISDLGWMQFTGLFAGDGTKIYEGDILTEIDDCPVQPCPMDKYTFIYYGNRGNERHPQWHLAGFHNPGHFYRYKVVGNVYENYDLLDDFYKFLYERVCEFGNEAGEKR